MIKRLFLVKAVPGDRFVDRPGQVRPAGYFQRFGITATTESEMLGLIKEYIDRDLGSLLIELEDQGEPDFEDQDAEIRHLVHDVERPGIWYVSGHAFYRKDESSSSGRSGTAIH